MKRCPKCGKELKDTAKFCGGCGARLEDAVPELAKAPACPKCGNTLKPTAKFCGKCGTRIDAAAVPASAPAASTAQASAPAAVPQPAAKAPAENSENRNFSLIGSFVHWNILPGQIATKIDENDIAAFGKCVKGLNIQEGLKALFLVKGKVVAQLDAGSYPFQDFGGNGESKGFWGGLCNAVSGLWNRLFGGNDTTRAEAAGMTERIAASVPPVSVVLIRSTEFPLVFTFRNANTANLRSDVALHVLCRINNINEFYANMLLDRKMVCYEHLSASLAPLFQNELNLAISDVPPQDVSNNRMLQERLLPQLQALMPGVFPFITLSRILNLTADQADMENLRRLSEELYVSEQELDQVMRRNQFLNRLQGVRNEQELTALRNGNEFRNERQAVNNQQELYEAAQGNIHHNAMEDMRVDQVNTDMRRAADGNVAASRIEADFQRRKEEIYEDMAMTQDERAKFDLLLTAERRLREAKSDDEVGAAMLEFERSGLLRGQEIEGLRHSIMHNRQMRDLNDAQLLAMTAMNNEQVLKQEQMEWEMQIGKQKLQNAIETRRMQDEYDDERRDKADEYADRRRQAEAQFADSRRQAQLDLDKKARQNELELDRQEQLGQLDMLRQAQALRMEREEAEHRRNQEAANAIRQHELDKQRLENEAASAALNAEIEHAKVYAGMTVEQIMAANPNLTEQAARALEVKFKNDNAVETANEKARMAADMQAQMNAFMQQQMQNKDKDTQTMRDMMMQMMQMNNQQNMQQMQMMRDQATAFAGAGQAAQDKLMAAKQAELEHTRADAAANSDRFVDGMKTTINAVGNMRPQYIPVMAPPTQGSTKKSIDEPYVYQGRQPAEEATPAPGAKNAPADVAPSAGSQPMTGELKGVDMTPDNQNAKTCPNCGEKLVEGAMFCDNCGAAL